MPCPPGDVGTQAQPQEIWGNTVLSVSEEPNRTGPCRREKTGSSGNPEQIQPPGPEDPPAAGKRKDTGTRAAAPPAGQALPAPAPRETYKLGAFLSRHLGAAERRRVLGALPARRPALPAAAERGRGGAGGAGGGALRLRVQPRPVPIHLPAAPGDGKRNPLGKSQAGV